MKKFWIIIAVFNIIGCAQPNTKTTIEFGIVNPQPDKTYKVFAELKTDTSSSRLYEDMDYLNPNVSDLMIQLTNFRTVGDTLIGEFTFNDKPFKQYLKAGLIQVNNSNLNIAV